MPWISAAVSIGTSLLGSNQSSKAAKSQADAYSRAQELQRQNIEYAKGQLSPYADAGRGALQQYQNILSGGLDNYESSDFFKNYIQQANRGVAGAAAATGGLRGGNVQGLLAQIRPDLLNSLRQQELGNQGSLIGNGLQAGGALAKILASGNNNISELDLANTKYQNSADATQTGLLSGIFQNNKVQGLIGDTYDKYFGTKQDANLKVPENNYNGKPPSWLSPNSSWTSNTNGLF